MSKRTSVELAEPDGVVHVVPHPTEADVWIARTAAGVTSYRPPQDEGREPVVIGYYALVALGRCGVDVGGKWTCGVLPKDAGIVLTRRTVLR